MHEAQCSALGVNTGTGGHVVCPYNTAGDGVHTASPLQPWLRQHCHGHCGAPDKYVSIMPVMLSAGKCPCLEMLRRG